MPSRNLDHQRYRLLRPQLGRRLPLTNFGIMCALGAVGVERRRAGQPSNCASAKRVSAPSVYSAALALRDGSVFLQACPRAISQGQCFPSLVFSKPLIEWSLGSLLIDPIDQSALLSSIRFHRQDRVTCGPCAPYARRTEWGAALIERANQLLRLRFRIMPSCATLATSWPSALKMRPRL